MAIIGAFDTHGEEKLEKIVWDVYRYLQELKVKPLARLFGNRALHKVGGSWTRINVQLSLFVEDPIKHYSKMMKTIEMEKSKFSSNSPYYQHLSELENFLRHSPQFSKDYYCLVRIPNGFEKRRMKTKIEPKE